MVRQMTTTARLKIKEIGRDQMNRWMMNNNSTVHENLTLLNYNIVPIAPPTPLGEGVVLYRVNILILYRFIYTTIF
jgi:hypothetical protein